MIAAHSLTSRIRLMCPPSTRQQYFFWVVAFAVFSMPFACPAAEPIWIPVRDTSSLSPLMVRGNDIGLDEPEAIGEFLVPAVTAMTDTPVMDSWAEFTVPVPKPGTYYLWGRLRYPTGLAESFRVTSGNPGIDPQGAPTRRGSSVEVRQWHWDSLGSGSDGSPGVNRLAFELPAGEWTFRVWPRQASATVFGPLRWRQADLLGAPRINIICLTDNPQYVPTDDAARLAIEASQQAGSSVMPTAVQLPPLATDQLGMEGRKRVSDWMRCPRWFTKDSWRDELRTRQAGDIARLVRHVAANNGEVLRLSCFWGGEAYYQSHVAPHVPGLGDKDYLREALDTAQATGTRIVAYMNPNALYTDHPLYSECAVRGPDGQILARSTYGVAGTTYPCINHPRYRLFLHDVLQEIFARYKPAGLYVDGLTPHVCFCEHCRSKWRQWYGTEIPARLSELPAGWAVWSEFGSDPQPVGDVENDADARRLTEMLLRSLIEVTHEFRETVKHANPDAITAFHSHPKPDSENDYDATLTEVYTPRPWVHTAWRSGELAGYSTVYRVPVLFNIYPHQLFTGAEARYHALQGLANGAYPNFWSALGMRSVFDYMSRCAEYLDFDRTAPVKFLALPRDLYATPTQQQTPTAEGISYQPRDRFLAPYVGAYSALMRAGLPVVTLHRPHFEQTLPDFQVLVLANVALMSDTQVEAVRTFVRNGGGLLATHETSLFDELGRRRPNFALSDVLGVTYQGTLKATPGRVLMRSDHPLSAGLPQDESLMCEEPLVAVKTAGADVVGSLPDGEATVLTHRYGQGSVVYMPARFDSMQCYNLTPAVERLFANSVRWLAHDELPVEIKASGPVAVSLFRQSQRRIVHLVNHQRDSQLQSVSCTPLEQVTMQVALPEAVQVKHVRRLWEDRELPFQQDDKSVQIELGTLGEYEAVAVEW